MEEEESKTLKETLADINEKLDQQSRKKPKRFRLPYKSKLSRGKLKGNWITVCTINDNHNVDFDKYQIKDNVIKMGDTIHAIDDKDIFLYKNKPIIFQPKKKINPYNPLDEGNETYGQAYIMARMEGDRILAKKSIGWGIGIGAIIIIGIIVYAILTGGTG